MNDTFDPFEGKHIHPEFYSASGEKVRYNYRYIVTKTDVVSPILIGEPFLLEQPRGYCADIFIMLRNGRYAGAGPNKVFTLQNREDISHWKEIIKGLTLIPDIKWAREQIDIKETEIADIREQYGLL